MSRSLVIFLLVAALSNVAWAGTSYWTLDQVTFGNGQTLSGSFSFNAAESPKVGNIQLSYFDGTSTHALSELKFGNADTVIVAKSGDGSPAADLRFDPSLRQVDGNLDNLTFTAYVGLYNAARGNLDVETGAVLANQTADGTGIRIVPTLPITAVLVLMGLMVFVRGRSLQKTHRVA